MVCQIPCDYSEGIKNRTVEQCRQWKCPATWESTTVIFPQRNLAHRSQVQTLKEWQKTHPQLFKKKVWSIGTW